MIRILSFVGLWIVSASIAFIIAVSVGSQFYAKQPLDETINHNNKAPTANVTPTQKLLFVSNLSGNYEIYEMDLETKETINLTNHPASDMNPQVSPDGREIVFYSNRENGQNHIFSMDLNTRTITKITNIGQNFDPSFSPDGQLITFKSTRDDKLGDIFVMNKDKSNLQNLTPSHKKTEEWDPVFSADGDKIFFVSRLGEDSTSDEIFSINLDGTMQLQLTNNKVSDWYPAFNPGSKSLIYISKEEPKENDNIYSRKVDSFDKRKLTDLPGNNDDPGVSLDGTKIVFINNNDGDYDVYIMNADGSDLKLILDTTADELSPVFISRSTL